MHPLEKVTVYTPDIITDSGDASSALNSTVTWMAGKPDLRQVVSGVTFAMGIIGPALRGDAKAFMQAIEALPPRSADEYAILDPCRREGDPCPRRLGDSEDELHGCRCCGRDHYCRA